MGVVGRSFPACASGAWRSLEDCALWVCTGVAGRPMLACAGLVGRSLLGCTGVAARSLLAFTGVAGRLLLDLTGVEGRSLPGPTPGNACGPCPKVGLLLGKAAGTLDAEFGTATCGSPAGDGFGAGV